MTVKNVSYSLEIHQNNEMIFNVNDFTGELIEETSYVLLVSLEYDTTYYWAVFPKSNSDIWNLNVDFESFRIDSPPADVILYYCSIMVFPGMVIVFCSRAGAWKHAITRPGKTMIGQ
jgi:hypothetical protein